MNNTIPEKDIKEALESIREIKKTLKTNVQFLRPFMYDRRFVMFSIIAAVITAVYFLLLHLAALEWGGFAAFPLGAKIGFIAAAVLFVCFSGWYKWRILMLSLKVNSDAVTIAKLLSGRELRVLAFDTLLMLVTAVALGFLAGRQTGNYMIIATFVFLFFGYQFFYYAAVLYLNEYRFGAFFSCVLAILTLILKDVPPLLLIGGSASLFMLVMALIILYMDKRS